jgi:hypothetical protein
LALSGMGHKPLKTDVEIRTYLDKNTNIPRNLRVAYPYLEEMMRTRSIDEARIEAFIKQITEDRISNTISS